jgi:hypothetical protein
LASSVERRVGLGRCLTHEARAQLIALEVAHKAAIAARQLAHEWPGQSRILLNTLRTAPDGNEDFGLVKIERQLAARAEEIDLKDEGIVGEAMRNGCC